MKLTMSKVDVLTRASNSFAFCRISFSRLLRKIIVNESMTSDRNLKAPEFYMSKVDDKGTEPIAKRQKSTAILGLKRVNSVNHLIQINLDPYSFIVIEQRLIRPRINLIMDRNPFSSPNSPR